MGHPVIILSIVTLVAVLAVGLHQWRSVRNSQARRGETPGTTTMKRHASREVPEGETVPPPGSAPDSPNPRITHPDESEIRSPREIRTALDAAAAPRPKHFADIRRDAG
jgi:hypothetical protein